MAASFPESPAEVLTVVESGPRAYPGVAWGAMVLLVSTVVVLPLLLPLRRHDVAAEEELASVILELQGRYMLGVVRALGFPEAQFRRQLAGLNTGSLGQRLRHAVLEGELVGADAALDALHDLQAQLEKAAYQPTESEQQLLRVLNRLYADYAREDLTASTVAAEERSLLQQQLGWYGRLALVPPATPDQQARATLLREAQRTTILVLSLVGLGFVVFVFGSIGLLVFGVLFVIGGLAEGLGRPSPSAGLYAETFAVWMALYLGLQILTGLFLPAKVQLPASGSAMILSLAALAWPVWRGLPWKQVREDIGWTAGRQPFLEPFLGLAGYGMAFPLLAVGVVVMLVLMALQAALQAPPGGVEDFSPATGPSHPIVRLVAGGNGWVRLQLLVLAAVLAPVVEETMFRGVLYRHLRDATRCLPRLLSFLLSALLVSFLFAVIHPQGLIAVPVLMALALAFNLIREWRGTLVPSMVAHGINNGLIFLFLILALSG